MEAVSRFARGACLSSAWLEDPARLHLRRGDELSLDECARLKESAKQARQAAHTVDEDLAVTLTYFVAVGLALALHGALITSMPRDELSDCLLDLAEAAPLDWRALLRQEVMGLS